MHKVKNIRVWRKGTVTYERHQNSEEYGACCPLWLEYRVWQQLDSALIRVKGWKYVNEVYPAVILRMGKRRKIMRLTEDNGEKRIGKMGKIEKS